MVRKVTVKVAPLYHPHLLHMCLENSYFICWPKVGVFTASAPQGQGCKKLKSSFQEAVLNGKKTRDGSPEVCAARCQSQAAHSGSRRRLRKQWRDLLQIKFIVIRMSWQKISEQPETHILPHKSNIMDCGQRSWSIFQVQVTPLVSCIMNFKSGSLPVMHINGGKWRCE